MINRDLTNLYLGHLDYLTDALYNSWEKSYCFNFERISKSKLNEQIKSFGQYEHIDAIKTEKPLFVNYRLKFKYLTWANKFTKSINIESRNEYYELHKRVIDEIETNLFVLKNKTDRIAYSNILLRNLDKNHIHKSNSGKDLQEKRYFELFELVLSTESNFENTHPTHDIIKTENQIDYSIPVCLLNHLEFIDNLIDFFSCFQIDLIEIA